MDGVLPARPSADKAESLATSSAVNLAAGRMPMSSSVASHEGWNNGFISRSVAVGETGH